MEARWTRRSARGRAALFTLALWSLAAPALLAATPPFDPHFDYWVRGDAAVSVSGPRCCGPAVFNGRFDARYSLDSAGQVTLTSLTASFDDTSVVVGTFLLFTGTADLRCPTVALARPANGWVDASGRLLFPAWALSVAGRASREREADGTCGEDGVAFTGANNVPASIVHEPLGTSARFMLTAPFAAMLDGDSYTFDLRLDGHFVNRPPTAVLGIVDAALPQGGCPAYPRWVDQEWAWVAEANSADGLRGELWSSSYDPDGAWPQADVVAENWFDTRDDGERLSLGEGRRLGPVTFEFGPRHRLELQAADHLGAWHAAACSFRVIDTTPPVVRPPAALTVGCSTAGGATAATSPGLAVFLFGGSASDVVDRSPARLTPQVEGADVTATRLFPGDGVPTGVSFRFRDASGNEGTADSTVSVRDTGAPTVALSLSPASLAADNKWWWITASLAATDDCGGPVSLTLVSIKSNAPALDPSDVLDAAFGSDDRGFYVRARQATPGVKRIYTVTYRATDAAGNTRLVSATVTAS